MVGKSSVDFIPGLPSGPLDVYRKMANFDWKKMKLVLENQDKLKIKVILKKTYIKFKIYTKKLR